MHVVFHFECFVLLHWYFSKYVCSAQYGCLLQFLDFVLSRYVAQEFSEWFWDGSGCPYCYWYRFCFYSPLIIISIIVSCHMPFFLVLLLNQRWSPLLRLQVSHCSTFRIMCDVPSIAVFCSESTECFPGISSKFFLKLRVTIPVAPTITGIIVHFRFHIRCLYLAYLL